MAQIKVSVATWNEIAAALEAQGKKLGENAKKLEIEAVDIERPVDMRVATIRRDAASIVSQLYQSKGSKLGQIQTFIEDCEEVFRWILLGNMPEDKSVPSIDYHKSTPPKPIQTSDVDVKGW